MVIKKKYAKEDKFVQVSLDIARSKSKSIGFLEKGILLYALSHSSEWRIQFYELEKYSGGLSKERLRKAIKNLVALGYFKLERERDKGRIIASYYSVFEQPISVKQSEGKPSDAFATSR